MNWLHWSLLFLWTYGLSHYLSPLHFSLFLTSNLLFWLPSPDGVGINPQKSAGNTVAFIIIPIASDRISVKAMSSLNMVLNCAWSPVIELELLNVENRIIIRHKKWFIFLLNLCLVFFCANSISWVDSCFLRIILLIWWSIWIEMKGSCNTWSLSWS